MASAELAAVLRAKNEAQSEVEAFRHGIEGAEKSFMGIPPAAAAAGVAITATVTAMVALGAAAVKLGQEFDDAFDSILIKSGATGQALEQLQEDFKAVVASVPTSFEAASTAIGLLNSRTGQTGEGLQQLATQMLNLSRLTGTDVAENVRTTTRVFGDWGIATEDQSEALDKLFRAAQMSGSSVSDIAQKVVQFGAPLRQLGVDFDSAVAMMTKFEKEGVNTETVMGTMRIALAKMAEVGLDPQETFGRLIATIQGMEDPLEATQLAMEVFGKRGGADMAAAIREGRFAIAEYVEDLQNAGGLIGDAAAKTDDAKQQMQTAWNELKVAAEPVVKTVFEAMNTALTAAIPLMKEFAAQLRNVAEAFKAMKEGRVTWQEVAAASLGIETRPESVGAGDLRGGYRPPGMAEAGLTMGGPEAPAPAPEAPPPASAPGLSAAEIAALRGNTDDGKAAAREAARAQTEAAREAERIRKEREREAARAVKEAERILQEQQRIAEREAEAEARRINTVRELGERHAQAIQDATEAREEAIQRAHEKTEQQISDALDQFNRQRDIEAQRKELQDNIAEGLRTAQEAQGDRNRGVQGSRDAEDLERQRRREDADLAERQRGTARANAEAEKREQAAVQAARFSGDSRAVTAAMLNAERAKQARDAQADDEIEAMTRRRQREDEDRRIRERRRAEDLTRAKTDAAEIKRLQTELSAPLETFNQKLVEDTLDKKIIDYLKAKEEAIDAANRAFETATFRADTQQQQGVDRANQQGMTQQQILNFYNTNNGVQGPDAIEEMIDDFLEEAASRLAHSG